MLFGWTFLSFVFEWQIHRSISLGYLVEMMIYHTLKLDCCPIFFDLLSAEEIWRSSYVCQLDHKFCQNISNLFPHVGLQTASTSNRLVDETLLYHTLKLGSGLIFFDLLLRGRNLKIKLPFTIWSLLMSESFDSLPQYRNLKTKLNSAILAKIDTKWVFISSYRALMCLSFEQA